MKQTREKPYVIAIGPPYGELVKDKLRQEKERTGRSIQYIVRSLVLGSFFAPESKKSTKSKEV